MTKPLLRDKNSIVKQKTCLILSGIIKPSPLNNKSLLSLVGLLLLGSNQVAYTANVDILPITSRPYASYAEFRDTICLPCHYRNIPNGTDLQKPLAKASEAELKAFLLPILRDGKMPPNEPYRKVLYNKFLQIK